MLRFSFLRFQRVSFNKIYLIFELGKIKFFILVNSYKF